jgi:cytidylate kinase
VIAIDGPGASGKSVVGAKVAERLGYRFLDTGAMYRAITWLALRRGVAVSDEAQLASLAGAASVEVETSPGGETRVIVDGLDATPHVRDAAVEANVSLVSRVPGVRSALVRLQRELAREGNIVMAGRDIGSVVLPDADVKVYLDASREVRAYRRAEQVRRSGGQPDVDEIRADLERRDGIDSTRTASPLTAAPDAVIISTDDKSIEEVVERVLSLAA